MKKIIIGIIIIVGGILLIKGISELSKMGRKDEEELQKSLKENLPFTYTLPDDYKAIINKLYINQISVLKVGNSRVKFRNPIALTVLSNKYQLVITKINLIDSTPLTAIFSEEKNVDAIALTIGKIYKEVHGESFMFNFKSGKVLPATKIHFVFDKDEIKYLQKNDSIYAFSVLANNTGILTESEDVPNIVVQKAGREVKSSTFFFIKKET